MRLEDLERKIVELRGLYAKRKVAMDAIKLASSKDIKVSIMAPYDDNEIQVRITGHRGVSQAQIDGILEIFRIAMCEENSSLLEKINKLKKELGVD